MTADSLRQKRRRRSCWNWRVEADDREFSIFIVSLFGLETILSNEKENVWMSVERKEVVGCRLGMHTYLSLSSTPNQTKG